MHAAIEFLGKASQPDRTRMGTTGVEIVHEDILGHWRWVFQRAWAGTKLPFFRVDMFFIWERQRGFQNTDVTILEAKLKFLASLAQ